MRAHRTRQSDLLLRHDDGIDRLAEPGKVIMVTDHEVLYGSPRAALYGVMNRQAAKQWKVGRFFDVGRGGHGHEGPAQGGHDLVQEEERLLDRP